MGKSLGLLQKLTEALIERFGQFFIFRFSMKKGHAVSALPRAERALFDMINPKDVISSFNPRGDLCDDQEAGENLAAVPNKVLPLQ